MEWVKRKKRKKGKKRENELVKRSEVGDGGAGAEQEGGQVGGKGV